MFGATRTRVIHLYIWWNRMQINYPFQRKRIKKERKKSLTWTDQLSHWMEHFTHKKPLQKNRSIEMTALVKNRQTTALKIHMELCVLLTQFKLLGVRVRVICIKSQCDTIHIFINFQMNLVYFEANIESQP